MNIVTVVGARPQFIKASVVSAAIRSMPGITEYLVHTGQHFDPNMSQIFFDDLDLSPPDVVLGIHGGSHGEMTGRMMVELDAVLRVQAPDLVLVYGDTNSTLAGALTASKMLIPVAHVEAGLRSFNRRMPEELNRILTDHVSTWLFAPTTDAVAHLEREGIDPASIVNVGDVMYDVALRSAARADALQPRVLGDLGLAGEPFVLATVHRAENTDSSPRLHAIVAALHAVSRSMAVVWPVHPRTRNALRGAGLLDGLTDSAIRLIEPQGYLEMVALERGAAVIVTDSGGVQKEAYFHGVPCVTVRDETEWNELIALGWNRLMSPDSAELIQRGIMDAVGRKGAPGQPYGDGHAAEQIVGHLQGAAVRR